MLEKLTALERLILESEREDQRIAKALAGVSVVKDRKAEIKTRLMMDWRKASLRVLVLDLKDDSDRGLVPDKDDNGKEEKA